MVVNNVGQQAISEQLMYIHLWRLGLSRRVPSHKISSKDGLIVSRIVIGSGRESHVGFIILKIRGEKCIALKSPRFAVGPKGMLNQ